MAGPASSCLTCTAYCILPGRVHTCVCIPSSALVHSSHCFLLHNTCSLRCTYIVEIYILSQVQLNIHISTLKRVTMIMTVCIVIGYPSASYYVACAVTGASLNIALSGLPCMYVHVYTAVFCPWQVMECSVVSYPKLSLTSSYIHTSNYIHILLAARSKPFYISRSVA